MSKDAETLEIEQQIEVQENALKHLYWDLESQDALIEAESKKQDMLGMVYHEENNPSMAEHLELIDAVADKDQESYFRMEQAGRDMQETRDQIENVEQEIATLSARLRVKRIREAAIPDKRKRIRLF